VNRDVTAKEGTSLRKINLVINGKTIIYKYLRQYTTLLVLMQLYFVLGDMFGIPYWAQYSKVPFYCKLA